MSHTYVLLEVTEAYFEISCKLLAAGYGHAFNSAGEIDMHGIALTKQESPGEATVKDGKVQIVPGAHIYSAEEGAKLYNAAEGET